MYGDNNDSDSNKNNTVVIVIISANPRASGFLAGGVDRDKNVVLWGRRVSDWLGFKRGH